MELRSSKPWLAVLAASFLLAVLFGVRLVNDSDLGFHLRTGQWILQNHRFPSQEAFTYTVPGHEYLDMEWLYQVAVYLAWKLGSYSFLSLLHIGLALLALGLLWQRLKEAGTSAGVAVMLFLLAVLSSEPRFRVRPEIPTWVFLALDLWVLESRANRRQDLLFLLPLVQLLWVNTEGIFFLGPVVMAFYLFSGWLHTRKMDPKLLQYSAASVALCLANPYFLRGALFPLDFLSTLGASDLFHQTVQEFQPPWSFTPGPWAPMPSYLWAYKGFCFFLLVLMAATARLRKAHEWLLALFFFTLSFMAVRNIPLFMIACTPLAAASWRDLKWDWLQKLRHSPLSKSFLPWVLVLFLLGFSARIVTNAHYVANRLTDRFGLGLDSDSQPVKACRFLVDNHLEGRIVNDLDDGDWLDWLVPQKTFIDGRLEAMGRDFRTQYVRSQAPGGLAALLAQYQPDIVLFNPLVVPQWAVDLQGRPDWRLVYLDSLNAIYLRKGYADQLPSLDYGRLLADNGISPSLLSQSSAILNSAPFTGGFGTDLFHTVDYPNNLLNLGIASNDTGNPQASELFFLEAIRRTQGRFPDFYYDLGLLYAYSNRRENAVLCMERVLKERPRDAMARQILGLPPSP